MQYPETELVLNQKGQVYHLGLSPDQLADKVILVGDQDRVAMAASLFTTIEYQSQHREFVCQTGWYNSKRVTVLSSGIGTDNIDIVMNELDALVNINLKTREDMPEKKSLAIVRVGTCGILQADIPVHAYLLSTHAIGFDNIAHFYEIKSSNEEESLLADFRQQVRLPESIIPYAVAASQVLNDKLQSADTFEGITVTSSGFYGPQGRQLRIKTKSGELNDSLTGFHSKAQRVVNFEMESSALFALGKAMGHECTTICLGIANRPKKEFSSGYEREMIQLLRYVFERI